MSNIYIQEPPTSGKVILKTTVGEIDVELWTRETPKTCRNFIQLCMEGYYNNTIFHRVVKGFIVQGGDPNGDGTGGESIYGATFKDEFHSRLRFTRRGLLAMANSGRDDNASQFFFTLGEAMELQNKHTIFGKVTGDTVFNMLKLEEGIVDHNERPMYPHKILKAEILLNPFNDIVPRMVKREEKTEKKAKKEKGVKNFGLLSFGDEAEEDEEETNKFVQTVAGKAKSTHDVLDDPKLSKETATFVKVEKDDDDDVNLPEQSVEDPEEVVAKIRDKLKSSRANVQSSGTSSKKEKSSEEVVPVSDSDSDEFGNELEKERQIKRKKKAEEIREQIASLKKQYSKDKRVKNQLLEQETLAEGKEKPTNEVIAQYESEQRKYSHLQKDLPKKGALREQHTLELLSKFKNKLEKIKETDATDEGEPTKPPSRIKAVNDNNDDDIEGDDWLSHRLRFEHSAVAVLAKDASTKQDDWYDVYDPRNPINKRKRGEKGGGSSRSNRK
ncbi:Spliceosome-associated protein CWC27 like [Pseudolycoriella hygida]|uniref:Spliceosome-associated protein CWC27 homolog n=1 Tax=Pseudolycoriella hygida TaxID=35572 RepID=A0A9Q0N5F6_9DIPT|nr:Spliceosome-associated protein CWC27 like [Pseudolycoriella hygida]